MNMDFNKILIKLGDFGKFQLFVFLLVCFIQIFCGIHMLANVFLMAEPKHRCYIENCDNNNTGFNEYFVNFTIPRGDDNSDAQSFSGCEQFKQLPGKTSCSRDSFTSEHVPCDRYIYDHSEYEETIVSKYDIVCKKSWNGATSQSIFMGGVLFGSAGFGMLGDKFGRKTVILTSAMVLVGSSIGTAFAPSFNVFTALRCVTAAAVSGLFQTGYVVALEFVGTSKRLWCANIMQIVFAIGELILGLVAYFVRKWKALELFISIPAVILLGYYWLLPESIRWLISKGKHISAKKTVLKAAKWNKKTIPDHLLRSATYTNMTETEMENAETQNSSSPLTLFKTKRLRMWTINIFFNWIVNSMVYYGLSLSAANLSGSAYLNFAILAAVEIPAVFLSTIALTYCGRRKVLCAIMLFGGLSCGSTVFVPQSLGWVSTTLAVLGKSAIAASFAVIYVYSAEIYPTVIRSTGIGMSSMFARFGSIIAPIINELRKVYRPLPMIIFSVASIIAAFLALALPETHNQQLPETIEETERFSISRVNDVTNVPRSRILGRFVNSVADREEGERLIT